MSTYTLLHSAYTCTCMHLLYVVIHVYVRIMKKHYHTTKIIIGFVQNASLQLKIWFDVLFTINSCGFLNAWISVDLWTCQDSKHVLCNFQILYSHPLLSLRADCICFKNQVSFAPSIQSVSHYFQVKSLVRISNRLLDLIPQFNCVIVRSSLTIYMYIGRLYIYIHG